MLPRLILKAILIRELIVLSGESKTRGVRDTNGLGDQTRLSSSRDSGTELKSRENWSYLYCTRMQNRDQQAHSKASPTAATAREDDRRGGQCHGERWWWWSGASPSADARPARSSVGNSRPLLSRTSTSTPAHRRCPHCRRAPGRADHAHRRPSTKNNTRSTLGSNRNREQSLGGAGSRSPDFDTYPPIII